ncbi:amino acid adenylation domain-containing protein [Streptosporangium sp. NPDC005286]|uniref:amino acid adenylation domain-containing protein n=1 Tax=Streptosporangium sp. NPDC005286 TaxID=3154463 RepID=UPI0033AB14C1
MAPQSPPTVLHLFRERVRSAPQAIALVTSDGVRTYQALDALSTRIADRINGIGKVPGSLVGVLADRSAVLVAAQLAVLKTGSAFVPLDPSAPADRLRAMLADARVTAVVTGREWSARLTHPDVPPLIIVEDLEGEDLEGEEIPWTDPGRLAYTIYTSGSTGRPKGVLVPHRGLLNLVRWHHEVFGTTAEDRTALIAGPAFDASVWEIWTYLTAGASIAIPDADTRDSLTSLRDWIVAQRITACFFPTPIAEALLGLDWPPTTKLRIMFTGGDRLTRYPPPGLPFRLVNIYGPTECSIIATAGEVPGHGENTGAPSIGEAINGTDVYLLDERLEPVTPGETGEIYIGGAGVARGYLGRPELTAECFVPDPFGGSAGARLYRTGDFARIRPGGRLDFVGRVDDQVQLRGYRVELGEVEAVLSRHPHVQSATVLVHQDQLVAYVVMGSGAAEELRAFLAARLPEYMVPARFVSLAEMPLTPNGKVDRRALPAARGAGAVRDTTSPRTPTEAVVAGVWRRVLGLERVGVHEDFFALGGQSLAAMRMAVQLEDALRRQVQSRIFFEHPTVAAVAREIDGGGEEPPPALVPGSTSEWSPLSPAQQRLWFIDRLVPGSALYNVPISYTIDGDLDAAALERAVNEIVRRHEPLRTRYDERAGVPVQHVATWRPVPFVTADLRGLPSEARAELVDADARTPFDLRTGPLLRALLLWLDDDRRELLLTVHHIAFDGWSASVFLAELGEFYEAFAAGRPPEPPALTTRYADLVAWSSRRLQRVAEEQLAFWGKRLERLPDPLELPSDRPRSPARSYRGAKLRHALPAELVSALESVGAEARASLFMVMFAAFQALLRRYTGQEDIVVGVPVAGRDHPEAEQLIGFFTNTLPLRTDLSGDPSFVDLLREVRRTALDASANADVPFERIVESLDLGGSVAHNPLVQVLFVMQEAVPAVHAAGIRVAMNGEIDNGCAKFDLLTFVDFPPDGPVLTAEYATELFDAETMERFLAHYEKLLWGVVEDPLRRISELPPATMAEPLRGPRSEPVGRCLHTLVEEQAARTPEAVAVEFEGACLTYAELDRRANQLAHHLRRAGVGADVPVALRVDRSFELAVAVLGILKAGGAYVPLDPSYPASRIEQVLSQVGAPVLVAERHLLDGLPAAGHRTVCLEADRAEIDRMPTSAPPAEVTPDHLAYVLFTSGSTGRPKGVAMPHRPIVNLLRWQRSAGGLGGAARTLQFTAMGFDVSCQEIFTTWAGGGTLVMVRDEVRHDAAALASFVEMAGIERLFLPFVALQHLAQAGVVPSRLRDIVTAGEQLRITPQIARLMTALPGAALHNHYGPTESHVVTAHTLRGDPSDWPDLPPIGQPVANVTVRILDRHGRPLPAGVPGELHLGGVCLARGYYRRPDLTADRFVPDDVTAGQRMYRTGDLARLGRNGTIEFLGRADDQVKIRGYRVEPGEVEAALCRHPAVRSAIVIAGEPDSRTAARSLTAYVVGEPADYRTFLEARLPEYMVPSAFVLLDAVPTTPSGKVDRRGLPACTPRSESLAAPGTALETVIAMTWSEVLGVEKVGLHDDFFRLGGHSLVATRVTSALREALDVHIPLKTLFERSTVAALARALLGEHGSGLEEAAELFLLVAFSADDDMQALLRENGDIG